MLRASDNPPSPRQKHFVVVPFEVLAFGLIVRGARKPQIPPFQRIVHLTVAILVLEAWADAEAVIRRDGHITAVEELVDVGTKQEAVRDLVIAAASVGDDMRRIECRQGVLARDGALAVDGLQCEAECALAKLWSDELLRAVPEELRL